VATRVGRAHGASAGPGIFGPLSLAVPGVSVLGAEQHIGTVETAPVEINIELGYGRCPFRYHPLSSNFAAAKPGTLAAVSWVTPSRADSEHPPSSVHQGQAYVTAIVNSAMKSAPTFNATRRCYGNNLATR
jgi:hypothetical protein